MANYNFISLKVKCPVCGEFLMDAEQTVDNEPSIRLNIEARKQKGAIRLSSIYGSYNLISDIDIPDNEVAKFSCPHCKSVLESKSNCSACDAGLVPLHIDMGGVVRFCSRKGCHNHNVEFEDLSDALRKLYSEHGFRGRPYPEHLLSFSRIEKIEERVDTKEIIETGTFLFSYCPHCMKSLIEGDALKFKVVKDGAEEGILLVSPYLNVHTSKSTIVLPEDKALADICCPHCNKSLIVDGGKCEECGTEIAKFLVMARTKMIAFHICAKKGCRWHGLSDQDMENIRLEDSEEW